MLSRIRKAITAGVVAVASAVAIWQGGDGSTIGSVKVDDIVAGLNVIASMVLVWLVPNKK